MTPQQTERVEALRLYAASNGWAFQADAVPAPQGPHVVVRMAVPVPSGGVAEVTKLLLPDGGGW